MTDDTRAHPHDGKCISCGAESGIAVICQDCYHKAKARHDTRAGEGSQDDKASENTEVRVSASEQGTVDMLRVQDAPLCWHKNIGDDTICKDCGHKAAIKFEPSKPRTCPRCGSGV